MVCIPITDRNSGFNRSSQHSRTSTRSFAAWLSSKSCFQAAVRGWEHRWCCWSEPLISRARAERTAGSGGFRYVDGDAEIGCDFGKSLADVAWRPEPELIAVRKTSCEGFANEQPRSVIRRSNRGRIIE